MIFPDFREHPVGRNQVPSLNPGALKPVTIKNPKNGLKPLLTCPFRQKSARWSDFEEKVKIDHLAYTLTLAEFFVKTTAMESRDFRLFLKRDES